MANERPVIQSEDKLRFMAYEAERQLAALRLENEMRRLGGKDYRRGTTELQHPDGPLATIGPDGPTRYHDFKLTPEIIAKIKEGLPYFAAAGLATPALVDMLSQPSTANLLAQQQ